MEKVWTSKNGLWTIHKSKPDEEYDWAIYFKDEEVHAHSRVFASRNIPKEVDLKARELINGEVITNV